jgi:hypothetical protein
MTEQLTLYQQAQAVHQDLMIQEQVAAQSLTQIAIDLKEIRDRRLYAELGYSDFAEYCENATKTGKRQAYNLISLVEQYKIDDLSRLAYLGSTKLIALKSLGKEEREELIESGKAEELSVRELKEKIKELTDKNEQLRFEFTSVTDSDKITQLETELKSKQVEMERVGRDKDSRINSLQARLDNTGNAMRRTAEENEKLKLQIAELEKRPVEVAVADPSAEDIAKIRAEVEAAARAEYDKKLADEKKKVQSIAHEEASGNSKEIFKIHLKNIQREFNEALELVSNASENERSSYIKAFRSVLNACGDLIAKL